MAKLLSIEVTGSAELLAALRDARAQLGDVRPLLETIGARLEANIERRFDSKRDPAGAAWQPLAASTSEGYDRQDTARTGANAGQVSKRGTLLERTGQMRNSLRSNVIGDDTVEVGMSRVSDGGGWPIPLLHEQGTTRMPRRGIFFADPDAGTLGAEDEADLDREIVEFLDDAFGAL